jgi:hypothetical protein
MAKPQSYRLIETSIRNNSFDLSLCVLANPMQSASSVVVNFFLIEAIKQKRSTVGTGNCIVPVSCRTESDRFESMQILDVINKYRYKNVLKNFSLARNFPSNE